MRGDSIELMPAYHEDGLRIEFFGDEIESLCRFHPLTGKVISKMETMVIYPAKHFITSGPKVEDAIKNFSSDSFKLLEVKRTIV